MKVVTALLVIGVAYSYGAAVPVQNDDLFDFLQGMFVEADDALTALGFQRVKRDIAHDKEFNLDKLGVHGGIKYVDPSNRWKGGVAHVVIDDLKKIVPIARSEKVEVTLTMDGGDAPMDGVFNLKAEYKLNHAQLETGTIVVDRTFDGKFWKTTISGTSSLPKGQRIIPEFQFSMKSDRQTILQVSHTSDFRVLNVNVDRVPGEKVEAVIEYNGKVYLIDGKLNKNDQTVKIDVNANGKNYEVNVNLDKAGLTRTVKTNINLGQAGSYQVEGSVTGMEAASLKVEFNGRPLVNLRMKGKIDKAAMTSKFEVRYTAVNIGEGRIRFGTETPPDNQVVKFQYLPKKGDSLKLEASRSVKGHSRHLKFEAQKNDVVISQYNLDIEPKPLGDTYELNVVSHLKITENSILYDKFCLYGCFNERKLVGKLVVENSAPYKLSLDVDVTKDSEKVFDASINTRQNPYVVKVHAPRLLPKITDDGRDTFDLTADHAPGQYLKVKSNSPRVRTLTIENLGNDMRRVELNGKELVRAAFSKGGNQIKQTTKLPDGRELTTTIVWATESMAANKVDIKLEGTERNFDGFVNWDLSNHDDMWVKAEGKGENKLVGPYEVKRDLSIKCQHNQHTVISLTGTSKNNDYDVDTDISADLNYETNKYSGKIKKVINGKSYALILDDGRVSVEM